MTKMALIRKEYGESFKEVVRGYAEMGYSRSFTASTLGINLSYFRQLCTRFDLHRHFKPQGQMRRECRQGTNSTGGWPKGKPRPRPPRYSFDEILAEVRKYPVSTLFESMSHISVSTVHRQFGSFTNALRAAQYESPAETGYLFWKREWENRNLKTLGKAP